jgi:hypothetical protein
MHPNRFAFFVLPLCCACRAPVPASAAAAPGPSAAPIALIDDGLSPAPTPAGADPTLSEVLLEAHAGWRATLA